MAIRESTRLFTVRCGKDGSCLFTQIEAKTAQEAIDKVDCVKSGKEIVTDVTSEPIYCADLGLECTDEAAPSDTSVFEIAVRGTNEELVDKLRDAIAQAIGGMAVEYADLESDEGRALQHVTMKYGLNINGM